MCALCYHYSKMLIITIFKVSLTIVDNNTNKYTNNKENVIALQPQRNKVKFLHTVIIALSFTVWDNLKRFVRLSGKSANYNQSSFLRKRTGFAPIGLLLYKIII